MMTYSVEQGVKNSINHMINQEKEITQAPPLDCSPLLKQLEAYRHSWASGIYPYEKLDVTQEAATLTRLTHFVKQTPDCFLRTHQYGHITGSALVTNPTYDKVLLTKHRKLGKWLQLGGHGAGENLPELIAHRETCEESGLSQCELVLFHKLTQHAFAAAADAAAIDILPFDIDIHEIPAYGETPLHYHYDVRYLIVADDLKSCKVSPESLDLGWFTIDAARGLTQEPSMLRQFNKLVFLRPHLPVWNFAGA
jgi:8-oxo-dGTP pyrophosphatase MutT (NUDIX family)